MADAIVPSSFNKLLNNGTSENCNAGMLSFMEPFESRGHEDSKSSIECSGLLPAKY